MDCEAFKENVEEYIKEEMQKHLQSCSSCREYVKDIKKLFLSYPDYEKDFEYPKDMEEKIKKSLKNIEKAYSL